MLNINIYILIIFFSLVVLMSSCSTMNESECSLANWYDVGLNDGELGEKYSQYSQHQKACSEFGINVDQNAYKEGWEIGIVYYCTADNGYRKGINGDIYNDSCPVEYESEFFSAYQMGRAIYSEQSQIDLLRDKLEKAGDDLERAGLTEQKRISISDKRKRLKADLSLAELSLFLAKSEARNHGFVVAF